MRRRMVATFVPWLFCLFGIGTALPGVSSTLMFDDCDKDTYYSGFTDDSITNKEELSSWVQSTHRNVVPYTSSSKLDVWDALIALDNEGAEGDVHLIYKDTEVDALPYGVSTSWNREHLWPKSRGVGKSGPDFSDVHMLRPSDWNINSARNNLFFGSCGIENPFSECQSPAHVEAAMDTAKDSATFLPPASHRGDISRAIFYMAIRYPYLELTDCPSDGNDQQMAYLSQLLQWHIDDPVDEKEEQRNSQVCGHWQGNRNPFVDFPQLAPAYFGSPKPVLGDGLGYDCDMDDTSPLEPGDVMFVSTWSDNPDKVVLVALDDISPGTELYLTDNAWTGTGFRNNEGVLKLVVPSEGIQKGMLFGYHDSSLLGLKYADEWSIESGSFQLSTAGDNIFVYTLRPDNSILFLSALLNTGSDWLSPEETNYLNSRTSVLPSELSSSSSYHNAVITFNRHFDNYDYVGTRLGTREELLQAISNPNNWYGVNSILGYLYDYQYFDVIDDVTEAPTPVPALDTCKGISAGDIMIVGFNSDNPDEVALLALDDLTYGAIIYMTDNAWNGSELKSNEGIIQVTIPTGGIPKGTVFGYSTSTTSSSLLLRDAWEKVSGNFALSSASDTILIYCLLGDNDNNEIFISALSYSATGWESADNMLTSGTSVLPSSLPLECSIELIPHRDNYKYIGSFTSPIFKNETLMNLSNKSLWEGSDNTRMNLDNIVA